jgi:hypothetical protein
MSQSCDVTSRSIIVVSPVLSEFQGLLIISWNSVLDISHQVTIMSLESAMSRSCQFERLSICRQPP